MSAAWPPTTAGPTTASIAPSWCCGPASSRRSASSFFPSIKETLNHILAVDLLYLDMLEEGGVGAGIFDDFAPFDDAARLAEAQAAFDRQADRILRSPVGMPISTGASSPTGARTARSPSASATCWRICSSTRSIIAARCMPCCPGTSVKPPQLDEFFLDYDLHAAARRGGAAWHRRRSSKRMTSRKGRCKFLTANISVAT